MLWTVADINQKKKEYYYEKMISRRNFLKVAGASAAALGPGCLWRFFQLHRFLHCQLCCRFFDRCKG